MNRAQGLLREMAKTELDGEPITTLDDKLVIDPDHPFSHEAKTLQRIARTYEHVPPMLANFLYHSYLGGVEDRMSNYR